MRDQVGAIAVVQAGKGEVLDQEAVRMKREGGSKCHSEDRTNRPMALIRQEG